MTILQAFLKKDYKIKEGHDLKNDGIGPYEYNGKEGCDFGITYYEGVVWLEFPIVEDSNEIIRDFIELYEEELREIFDEYFVGVEEEIEKIVFDRRKDKGIDINICYHSRANDGSW